MLVNMGEWEMKESVINPISHRLVIRNVDSHYFSKESPTKQYTMDASVFFSVVGTIRSKERETANRRRASVWGENISVFAQFNYKVQLSKGRRERDKIEIKMKGEGT